MMASNLLSRLLPTNPSGRSIYDDLRAHDEADSDVEENAGLALDEENLGFHDDDLGNADAFNGDDSRITTESTAFLTTQQHAQLAEHGNTPKRKGQVDQSKWMAQSPRLLEEDGDDDVPASLLIEGNGMPGPSNTNPTRTRHTSTKRRQPAIPGPSNRETRAHWEAAQAQQRLHEDYDNTQGPQPIRQTTGPLAGSAREKAMWRWINVVNLDNFIKEVYDFYTGSGMWCIMLEKILNLA
jgi:autophagy-related protein 9